MSPAVSDQMRLCVFFQKSPAVLVFNFHTLWPFYVVIPKHKNCSCYFVTVIFVTVMNHSVNIWYAGYDTRPLSRGHDLQMENHWSVLWWGHLDLITLWFYTFVVFISHPLITQHMHLKYSLTSTAGRLTFVSGGACVCPCCHKWLLLYKLDTQGLPALAVWPRNGVLSFPQKWNLVLSEESRLTFWHLV